MMAGGIGRDFYVAGDFNIELGLLCTGAGGDEELDCAGRVRGEPWWS